MTGQDIAELRAAGYSLTCHTGGGYRVALATGPGGLPDCGMVPGPWRRTLDAATAREAWRLAWNHYMERN